MEPFKLAFEEMRMEKRLAKTHEDHKTLMKDRTRLHELLFFNKFSKKRHMDELVDLAKKLAPFDYYHDLDVSGKKDIDTDKNHLRFVYNDNNEKKNYSPLGILLEGNANSTENFLFKLETLLAMGANPDFPPRQNGPRPVHAVIQDQKLGKDKSIAAIDRLFKYKADPQLLDHRLLSDVIKADPTVSSLALIHLVENGFDINKTDELGNTILHKVAQLSDLETVTHWTEEFVENGADVTLRNNQNETAYDVLMKNGLFRLLSPQAPETEKEKRPQVSSKPADYKPNPKNV